MKHTTKKKTFSDAISDSLEMEFGQFSYKIQTEQLFWTEFRQITGV
jgi:hypothetical protein